MIIDVILSSKGREVSIVAPGTPVAEVVQRMRNERIGALVVSTDGRTIKGIISDRGVMHAIADHGVGVMQQPIEAIMAQQVVTCRPTDPVGAIMGLMTERRIRHIPVVDSDGQMCGIISIGDVVKNRLDAVQREAEAMREYISGVI
ncbi:MAG: CBS domain-containing protein [Geminicoccaceae bacterium]